MKFQSANPEQRVPAVLSVAEVKSLFAQMDGTPRLMAELAYGAGLRLMELLLREWSKLKSREASLPSARLASRPSGES